MQFYQLSTKKTKADLNFCSLTEFYGARAEVFDEGQKLLANLNGNGERSSIAMSQHCYEKSLSREERIELGRIVAEGADMMIYDIGSERIDLGDIKSGLSLKTASTDAVKRYAVCSGLSEFAFELQGQHFSCAAGLASSNAFFAAGDHGGGQSSVIDLVTGEESRHPVFLKIRAGRGNLLLLAGESRVSLEQKQMRELCDGEHFTEILPMMMFIRFCGGERLWHRKRHLANFTVDDPWLIQPYGHLDYFGLLGEMEEHGFHTTIAFTPWNFKRSREKVVQLFLNHPDRYSIAVHGNNHDLNELSAKSPDRKIEQDAAQALLRMEQFSAITGIPYSKVMVFPRRLGTVRALAALRRHGFYATANARTVPDEADPPPRYDFQMYPAVLDFEDFPLLGRRFVGPEGNTAPVALDLFLGKPALLYGHHDYFKEGPGAFNSIAQKIQQLASPRWDNLEYIANNLFLEKTENGRDIEIRMFGNLLHLSNESEEEKHYKVSRVLPKNIGPNLGSAKGETLSLRKEGGFVNFEVTLPGKTEARFHLHFDEEKPTSGSASASTSPRLLALRLISDFRDLVLTRASLNKNK